MSTATLPHLTARGAALDTSEEAFGELRGSMDVIDDAEALRQRMADDGYLYLRGYLNRDDVIEARRVITDRLAAQGFLHPDRPTIEAICRPGARISFKADLAKDNAALDQVLYAGPMMEFYRRFLGGPVRHFDYTWFRAMGPGMGTPPHCDVVYMGRGTKRLYTAWAPIGDISLETGGLMILEKSNQKADRFQHYLERDVDTYCANGRHAKEIEAGQKDWEWDGSLAKNPASLRAKLGGRWLTAEYRAGDLLTFSLFTVHASLDNHSNVIRLSSDSRYQRADEPADERWIGTSPIAHGRAGKRGRIC